MQGVDGTFQLREFEAYETVNKDHLKETLKAADDKLKEYGIQYGDEKYKEFFAAYMEAESAYENAYALNHNAVSYTHLDVYKRQVLSLSYSVITFFHLQVEVFQLISHNV